MRREHLLPVILAVGLPLAAGCNHQPAQQAAGAGAAGPAVSVVKPERKGVTRVIEQPGAIQPIEEAELFARVPGYVSKIAADPGRNGVIDIGSRVKAGQVLAELSIPEVVEEANQKEALVKQAGAEVEQAKKALVAADAGVSSAEALVSEARAGLTRSQALYDRWQSELTRIGGLVRGGVIDAQTRDETQNQFKAAQAGRDEAAAKVSSAEAGVRKARADRDKTAADVTAAEAKQEVTRADARRLAALVGYGRIVAPFDGVVTRRAVSTGDFLNGTGKQGVFRVARTDPLRVVVHVPEADAGLVREGLEVRLTVQALANPKLTGKIARTSWSLEPGSRTLRTEIDLPNPDAAVRPGMYVYAGITVQLPEEWSVPAAAVGKAGDEFVVYRVVDGKAARTPVQIGHGDGRVTQVRRYKAPGATDWTAFTGSESVATPAATLTDGQTIAGP
ncbi:MAG TPA: efflux RND transporter periplasmic adaptor subunit [Fimbriiglobus sp.]|nr:efflux RND transporter periplasmic adaptor subunit [Fimbriiglobus sp.]